MTANRLSGTVASLLAAAVLLTGCASGGEASPAGGGGSPSQEPMQETQTPMRGDDEGMREGDDRMRGGEDDNMRQREHEPMKRDSRGRMKGGGEEPM